MTQKQKQQIINSAVHLALNEFEKQDSLVVITRLNLRSGSPVAGNIEYAIYYK